MPGIATRLRRSVVERAQDRCEYCRLPQEGQEATFHIDHIVPLSAGGVTEEANLALACVSCSLRKGDRSKVPDPSSGEETPIFNPRSQDWFDHFQWEDLFIVGVSAVGRATVKALNLNRPVMVQIRRVNALLGRVH